MNPCAIEICFWTMCVLLFLPACAGTGKPPFKIQTRTLNHAPDGNPDSRLDVGIGERIELKAIPETIGYVEWIVEGGSLTNRFGNPTVLIAGGDAGKLSISAKVHDEPHAASPHSKKNASTEKWRLLEAQLQELEKLADKPSAFESHCDTINNGTLLYEGLAEAQGESLKRFGRLLNDISDLSRRAPGSNSWARIQSKILEASAMRLGVCLDSTADKSRLEKDFWALLHTCASTLECQHQQFEKARRNAKTHVQIEKPPADPLNYERSGYMVFPKGPIAVASAFSSILPDVRYLLYVQVLNALPKTTQEQKRMILIKHGFSKAESALLLNDLECRFDPWPFMVKAAAGAALRNPRATRSQRS